MTSHMKTTHPTLWLVAKWLCYTGGILVAITALMIGGFHQEPPTWLFDSAMAFTGVGVLIGSFVAIKSIDRDA